MILGSTSTYTSHYTVNPYSMHTTYVYIKAWLDYNGKHSKQKLMLWILFFAVVG